MKKTAKKKATKKVVKKLDTNRITFTGDPDNPGFDPEFVQTTRGRGVDMRTYVFVLGGPAVEVDDRDLAFFRNNKHFTG